MSSGWNLWVWLVGVAVRRYIDTIKAGCPRTTLTMENVFSLGSHHTYNTIYGH